MAYTRAQLKTKIKAKFNNRTDLDTDIENALDDAQDTLEMLPEVPWFLLKDTDDTTNLTLTSGNNTIDLPSDYLIDYEYGGLFVYVATATPPWVKLRKDDFDNILADKTGTGRPSKYSLKGLKWDFRPTADQNYTIRAIYKSADDKFSDDDTANLWSTYAPLVLLNRAGMYVAERRGYMRQLKEFGAEFADKLDLLNRRSIAIEMENMQSTMGDS